MRGLLIAMTLMLPAYASADDWTFAAEAGLEISRMPSADLLGDDPLFYASLRAEHSSGAFVYYRHQCSFVDGWPFNDKKDQMWLDAVGVGFRYEFGK